MPNARIEVRRPYSREQKLALMEAVHGAMVEALKIPPHDRLLRLQEYDPADFAVPPGASENYTLVEITLFPGRSLDAKRALYQAIVRNLGVLGIAANDVRIVLYEPPLENWGIRGGRPGSEVDLGVNLKV